MEVIKISISHSALLSQIKRVVSFHGHLSAGVLVGIRIFNIASRTLGSPICVICETFSCMPDAVECGRTFYRLDDVPICHKLFTPPPFSFTESNEDALKWIFDRVKWLLYLDNFKLGIGSASDNIRRNNWRQMPENLSICPKTRRILSEDMNCLHN